MPVPFFWPLDGFRSPLELFWICPLAFGRIWSLKSVNSVPWPLARFFYLQRPSAGFRPLKAPKYGPFPSARISAPIEISPFIPRYCTPGPLWPWKWFLFIFVELKKIVFQNFSKQNRVYLIIKKHVKKICFLFGLELEGTVKEFDALVELFMDPETNNDLIMKEGKKQFKKRK